MNPLFAVRDRLREHGMASAALLTAELQLPRAVVDDALAHWLRRGYARQVSSAGGAWCGAGCGGGCTSCTPAAPDMVFRWQGRTPSSPHKAVAKTVRIYRALPGSSLKH